MKISFATLCLTGARLVFTTDARLTFPQTATRVASFDPLTRSLNQETDVFQDHAKKERELESSDDSEDESSDDSGDGSSDDSEDGSDDIYTSEAGLGGSLNANIQNWTAFEGQLDCNLYREVSLSRGRIQLREVVNPIDETVTIEMTYAGHGWVGVAVNSNGRMTPNMAIIGVPSLPLSQTNPGKYWMSAESVAGVQLMPEEKQTLIDTDLVQNATHTTMRFTKYLSEPGEREILANGVNKALYATGRSNNLGMHNHAAAFHLSLTYCLIPGQDINDVLNAQQPTRVSNKSRGMKESLWAVHGFFMALCWVVFVPLAIAASVLRAMIPGSSKVTWMALHKSMNIAGAVCLVIGLLIAIVLNGADGLEDLAEFEAEHSSMGWLLFLLAMAQMVSGFRRPSAPPTNTPVTNLDQQSEIETTTMTETPPADATTPAVLWEDEEEIESMTNKDVVRRVEAPPQKSLMRVVWEYQHRWLGFVLLLLSVFTIATGLHEYDDRFQTTHGLRGLVWVAASIVGTGTVGLWAYNRFLRSMIWSDVDE